MNQTRENDVRIQYLMEQEFPFVTHGRSKWSDKHSFLNFDNFEFIRLAARKLHKRGRCSLLMITPHQAQNYAQNMISGANAAEKELNISVDIIEEPNNQFASKTLKNILQEFFRSASQGDRIICCTVMTTAHLLPILKMFGKTLGKDIDRCAKERFTFFSLIRPDVLTIKQDLNQAGSFLAKAALHAIERPADPPLQLLVTPKYEENDNLYNLSTDDL